MVNCLVCDHWFESTTYNFKRMINQSKKKTPSSICAKTSAKLVPVQFYYEYETKDVFVFS